MKKLFKITIVQAKNFYVEAESEEAALRSDQVDLESDGGPGEFDFEHVETEAKEVTGDQAKYIRKGHPELILK